MRSRTTITLLVLAVIAVGGGWWLSRQPATQQVAAGTLVFPGLASRLDQASKIEIQHQGSTLTLARDGGAWGLADRGGYKVQPGRVRELLEGLTELRMTEPRTSDPTEYKRLGVEDPKDPAATSNLLRVLTAQGTPLAELIVGHRRVRMQGDVPESVYVRRPNEVQAWLAEGRMPVDADAQQWIDRDILTIDHAKIASVTVERKDGTLKFERKGDALTLTAPADHPKLDNYKVEDVGRALENLTLTDVKPVAQEPGEKLGESNFTLTDGERIAATVFRAGAANKPETWARFAVSGDGPAKAAADKLESQVKDWTYQIGAWKEPALLPNLGSLKASEPAPPTTPPATPNEPGPLPEPAPQSK